MLAVNFLKENPDIAVGIEAQIRAQLLPLNEDVEQPEAELEEAWVGTH